jgi:hypothetical protein
MLAHVWLLLMFRDGATLALASREASGRGLSPLSGICYRAGGYQLSQQSALRCSGRSAGQVESGLTKGWQAHSGVVRSARDNIFIWPELTSRHDAVPDIQSRTLDTLGTLMRDKHQCGSG